MKSFTEKMLDLCIEGMGENLEVHKFYPHKMNIGPCTSCWSCWGKKRPGECIQEDDFQQILDVYKRADYFLLAAPHFHVICEHMDWIWSGDILISAAGLANAPILFDRKYELIRKAGAELIKKGISKETTEEIAAPVMPAEDYRRITTLNFTGGPDAEAEIVTIAMRAMRC